MLFAENMLAQNIFYIFQAFAAIVIIIIVVVRTKLHAFCDTRQKEVKSNEWKVCFFFLVFFFDFAKTLYGTDQQERV
jgi:hypothetical protein